MATNLDNLLARKAAIIAELAALDSTKAGGLPNAPGQPDHQGYKQGLYDELAKINQLISAEDGPYEIAVQGVV